MYTHIYTCEELESWSYYSHKGRVHGVVFRELHLHRHYWLPASSLGVALQVLGQEGVFGEVTQLHLPQKQVVLEMDSV